jgi:hypothetical protein
MSIVKEIVIYNTLFDLAVNLSLSYDIFNNSDKIYDLTFKNKIICSYKNNEDNINSIRIWKSKCFYSYYFNDIDRNNFIGGIDYKINKDNIEIFKLEGTFLSKYVLLQYMDNIAKYNNITKLIKRLSNNNNQNFYNYKPMDLIISLNCHSYFNLLSKKYI